MKALSLSLFLLCLSLLPLHAQEDLREDEAFFKKKAEVYQAWLNDMGVGQYLEYRELYANQDTLFFYLEFRSDDLDYNIAAWEKMKKEMEQHTSFKFEEQLYHKFLFMMELKPQQGNIQLYDTYDPYDAPLFEQIIYFDEEGDTVAIESAGSKSQSESIDIDFEVNGSPTARTTTETLLRQKKEVLFREILSYCRKNLIKPNGRGGKSQFVVRERGEKLVIEVSDLSKEILKDANNSWVCDWADFFGWDCIDITREKLQIRFGLLPLYGNKLRIEMQIDGMFASGAGKAVRRGAYKDMELDSRFRTYIELYADQFKINLEDYLTNN